MPTDPTFYATKDPAEILDYSLDYTAWLTGAETVASATVTAPTGITVSAPTVASPKVTVRITGGTLDTPYLIVWHAVTSTGQEPERTLRLDVRDR